MASCLGGLSLRRTLQLSWHSCIHWFCLLNFWWLHWINTLPRFFFSYLNLLRFYYLLLIDWENTDLRFLDFHHFRWINTHFYVSSMPFHSQIHHFIVEVLGTVCDLEVLFCENFILIGINPVGEFIEFDSFSSINLTQIANYSSENFRILRRFKFVNSLLKFGLVEKASSLIEIVQVFKILQDSWT